MIIIPAIDIRSRKVVRLKQGDFDKQALYSDDAVEVAMRWQGMGAKSLHIVDLDGALSGEPRNLDIVEKVYSSVGIPIQLGGGLRSDESVERVLSKGISRAIVGTRAYKDEEFIKRLIDMFGSTRIAVAIDAAGGIVVSNAWKEPTDMNAVDIARKMESLGVDMIIYTDVLKDGTLESPQIDLAKEMLDAVSINVIISGGVSSLQDVKDLKALNRPNLYGVITGKALYESRLDLREAISIAEEA